MAESIILSIVSQIGKEAFHKWQKNAKSKKINPKRILNNIDKRIGHRYLLKLAEKEFLQSWGHSDPKLTKEYKKLLTIFKENQHSFSSKQLKQLLMNAFKLYRGDRGEKNALAIFTDNLLEVFFPERDSSTLDLTLREFEVFKRDHLKSRHLIRNYGVTKKEFYELLILYYCIDLEKDLNWEQINDRVLFMCWMNDIKPEDFSLLK